MKDMSPLLVVSKNCWRIEKAGKFAFIVDAADYFVAVRAAMLKAEHSIYLIGWDFDTALILQDEGDHHGPDKLGEFIMWLADRTPSLQIRLLRWDTGAFKSMLRGKTLFNWLRWKWHKQITLKLDGAHPLASSHHQKIVVIDDCIAFCGGIDVTNGRWDTREHLDDNPKRIGTDGKPYAPWHDATSAFDGDAARAMGDLARMRWLAATGEQLEASSQQHDCWPDHLRTTFTDVSLAVARTRPEMKDVTPIHEIEEVYIDLISSARRWIYAESQYFASRRIAYAIAKRLAEEDGPEIVIINPITAEGWLEPIAMDTARARLMEALQRIDKYDRLRMYHPVTAQGEEIYVHAKVMIVDDRCLRVGSSNFNNRSLRLDSECDVILSTDEPGNEDLQDDIVRLRDDLIAEHLGVSVDKVAKRMAATGSLIATIEDLRASGSGRSFRPYELPDLNGFEEWLADNEILDPEGPDAIFESMSNRGLFHGWKHYLRSGRKSRKH